MPAIPRPRVSVQPTSGSVGRLRVDAPVEAFTGGAAGLKAAGSAVATAGAAIQQHGKKQEKAAQNRKAQEGKLEFRRRRNDYQRAINSWVNENKNSPNRQQARNDFDELRKDLKKQYATMDDQGMNDLFTVEMDEWDNSHINSMDREDNKFYEAENIAQNERAIGNEEDAIVEQSDAIMEHGDWNTFLNEDIDPNAWIDAGNTAVEEAGLGEEQATTFLEDGMKRLQVRVLDKAADKIQTALDPDQAAATVKQYIDTSELGPEEKEKMGELVDASLATRKANDIRAVEFERKGRIDSAVEQVGDPDATLADINELVVQAEAAQDSFISPSDPTGQRGVDFIKKAVEARKAPWRATAELDVVWTQLTAGPDAAEVMNRSHLENGLFNYDQYRENQVRIGRGVRKEIADGVKDAITQIKSIIKDRDGTVFAARLVREGEIDNQKEIAKFVSPVIRPHLAAAEKIGQLVFDDKDDFEGLDREIGEEVGLTARATAYDQYQLSDQDMSQLFRTVEVYAEANDIKDPNKLISFTKELLFSSKRGVAMLNYQTRIARAITDADETRRKKVTTSAFEASKLLDSIKKKK